MSLQSLAQNLQPPLHFADIRQKLQDIYLLLKSICRARYSANNEHEKGNERTQAGHHGTQKGKQVRSLTHGSSANMDPQRQEALSITDSPLRRPASLNTRRSRHLSQIQENANMVEPRLTRRAKCCPLATLMGLHYALWNLTNLGLNVPMEAETSSRSQRSTVYWTIGLGSTACSAALLVYALGERGNCLRQFSMPILCYSSTP